MMAMIIFLLIILLIMMNIKKLIIFIIIVLIIMLNITGLTTFLIIILVIYWLQKKSDDSSCAKKDDKGSTNFRRSYTELRLPQIGKYEDKYLWQTKRETNFHPLNNLERRVVHNNRHLHLSRGASTKCNTVNTSKPRTTKYVTNDAERKRCFVSRKEALLKKTEEIATTTGCDIYVEMKYEEKPHIYKSETIQNISLEPEDMDVDPSHESKRSQNKRRIESGDDSDTDDNGLSPVKIQKTDKATKDGRMHDQKESEIDTNLEFDEMCCNICGITEDNNDNRGIICDYQYADLSFCSYTAHLSCLDLHEYPQNFLCPEHIE